MKTLSYFNLHKELKLKSGRQTFISNVKKILSVTNLMETLVVLPYYRHIGTT